MFIFGADVEQIPAGNAVGPIVENVQTVAAPDQHQFTELMGVLSKDVLRIAIRHRDGLACGGKKIIFTEN
ncbi:hypothetical protein D3C76_1551580 [compost metagenome]